MDKLSYPYLPAEGRILHVKSSDTFMQAAKETAREFSLDKIMPTGSVVVKNDAIIGSGANGSAYHETHECERVRLEVSTGKGYELCEGCHPKNHSEPRAIKDALRHTPLLEGAALYLWGHWWCCESCWSAMLRNGIDTVCLMVGSDVLFNKSRTGNIVGRQFR